MCANVRTFVLAEAQRNNYTIATDNSGVITLAPVGQGRFQFENVVGGPGFEPGDSRSRTVLVACPSRPARRHYARMERRRRQEPAATMMREPPASSRNHAGRASEVSGPTCSNTRLVDANSKMIALTKLAPLRNRALATATAACEQDELAAPKPHARKKPFRSGLPSAPATARFRNDRLDHHREQKAEGERPQDLPQHEKRDLRCMQDGVDDKQLA